MRINHNLTAMNAHRQMGIGMDNASKSTEKLSSGLRINKAGDDAAGLSISEKMRAQIRGLNQASRNSQDGISMIQTAEGALNETQSILQRMRELAVQSSNDTNVGIDRGAIQNEMNQLTSEINRIGNTTEFNTQKLLNGGMDQSSGNKITKATSANVKGTTDFVATDLSKEGGFAKVTVGDTTFDLHEALTKDWTDMDGDGTNRAATITDIKNALEQVQSGDTKLSDVLNIEVEGSNLKFTSKSEGANSEIKVEVGKANTAKVLTFTEANGGVTESKGTAATVSKHGVESNIGLTKAKIAEVLSTGALATKQAVIGTAAGSTGTVTTLDYSGANAKTFRINDHEITLDENYSTFADLKTGLQMKIDEALGVNKVQVGDGTAGQSLSFKSFESISFSGDIGTHSIYIKSGKESDKAYDFTAGTVSFTITTKIDGTDVVGTIHVDDKAYDNLDSLMSHLQTQIDAKFGAGIAKVVADDRLSGFNVGGGFNIISEQTIDIDDATNGIGSLHLPVAGSYSVKNVGDAVARKEIADGSTFSIKVGEDSAVAVNLKQGSYAVNSSDENTAKAEMDRLVKDINSSLQEAGLGGKVSASLSQDNELQFISETGQNITLSDGAKDPLKELGFDSVGMNNSKEIEKLVGPGTQGSGFNAKFQVGANTGQSMSLTVNDMRAAALGITGSAGQAGFTTANSVTDGTNDVKSEAALDVSSHEKASAAVSVINDAIEKVSAERSNLGSVQNRLEHTIRNLDTASENLQSSESRIRDVDMAKEMMESSKNSILKQAAQAMLAQANQDPQQILQLLR